MSQQGRHRVLGVDPGFDRLGLAVLEGDPSKPTCVWSTCISIPGGTKEARLACVYTSVSYAIAEHTPDLVVVEDLFFSTNKKTALSVAEARGAVLSAIGATGTPVREYTPMQVKVAVTGYGGADKKAVERMVLQQVQLPPGKRLDDEYDAIAIALCGLSTRV